jgi:hypothetical protein
MHWRLIARLTLEISHIIAGLLVSVNHFMQLPRNVLQYLYFLTLVMLLIELLIEKSILKRLVFHSNEFLDDLSFLM